MNSYTGVGYSLSYQNCNGGMGGLLSLVALN